MLVAVTSFFSANSFAEGKSDRVKAIESIVSSSKELHFTPEEVPGNLTAAWMFFESKVIEGYILVETINLYERVGFITANDADKFKYFVDKLIKVLQEASDDVFEMRNEAISKSEEKKS